MPNASENSLSMRRHHIMCSCAPGLTSRSTRKRASDPATRNAAISRLKSDLRGELHRVEQRTGKKLSSYLLWTNLHLTTEQAEELRTAILERYPDDAAGRPHVGVVGAAQLAAMLNDLPHLRSGFFATGAFRDWGGMREAHRRRSVPLADDTMPALVGRREEMEKLAGWIADPNVRAVILTGPHGIGKHRLVIEATCRRDVDVVESLNPEPSPDEISRLSRVGRETIVVLENAESEAAPSSAFLTIAEIVAGPRFENSGLMIQPLWHWFKVHDTIDDGSVVDFAWRCLQSAPVAEDRANG